jgi:hypothetical protein
LYFPRKAGADGNETSEALLIPLRLGSPLSSFPVIVEPVFNEADAILGPAPEGAEGW